MDSSVLLRQLLRSPSTYLHFLATPLRPQPAHFSSNNAQMLRASQIRQLSTASLPRILQPSLWASLVPKFLRRTPTDATQPLKKTKKRNPATPFILLSLFVGSQAIQTLWLKREMAHFSRRADAKIGLLREVIERVQRGEDVDVEKVLGTGKEGEESEWKEVLKEIEEEEMLFQTKKRRRALREKEKQEQLELEEERKLEAAREKEAEQRRKEIPEPPVKVVEHNGARFY